jgi:hypothetical protein
MKECGGGGRAESPSYRRGKQKAKRCLDPHDRHNDHVHRVISPRPIGGSASPRSGLTPRRTCPAVKGPKAHTGEKGYGLKTPRRPTKVLGFEGWPTNGFTTAPGHHKSKGRRWMGPLAAST